MLLISMSRTTSALTGASIPSISCTAAKPSSANRVSPMQSSGGDQGAVDLEALAEEAGEVAGR